MKRRDFIKTGLMAGLAGGLAVKTAVGKNIFNNTIITPDESSNYDLVAVQGGNEPTLLVDKALEALGGMQQFVKKGDSVVVKPNIGWDQPAEMGANTNPAIVKRIISHCFNAGASKVVVFDHTCDTWQKCYKNSGIKEAAEAVGASVISGDEEVYYQEINIPKGVILKKAKVHKAIIENDIFINIPILKVHGGGQVTICMKNLMGVVWDRRKWHNEGLHQCIADFATWRSPDLNIVDAWRMMTRNGPRGKSPDDVVLRKSLLASRNMLAADVAATKLLGLDPSNINQLQMASISGIGTMDLDQLNIKKISL